MIRVVGGCLFSFGFMRQYNGSYNQPTNKFIKQKYYPSILNGILYIIPPYTIYSFYNLLRRIEIKISRRNPYDYINCYEELVICNYNIL